MKLLSRERGCVANICNRERMPADSGDAKCNQPFYLASGGKKLLRSASVPLTRYANAFVFVSLCSRGSVLSGTNDLALRSVCYRIAAMENGNDTCPIFSSFFLYFYYYFYSLLLFWILFSLLLQSSASTTCVGYWRVGKSRKIFYKS